jgi:hypothetical protein
MFHPRAKAALAGLQFGVLGGLAMLAAMCASSLAEHDSWWSYPNLLGATFYGSRVLRGGAGWATLSGISLQILLAGSAGAVFALTFSRAPTGLRTLLGVAWGAALFYASREFYRMIAPLVALYAPETSMLLGHMLLGLFFARARVPRDPATHRYRENDAASERETIGVVPGIGDLPAARADRDGGSSSR